jgi:hypothetical protein|tara:strand:+ start:743 stop:934 length:192 start_codon:yes stop_codon:yes gene_type:complete
MYYYFEKDSRKFSFSCNIEVNHDPTKHIRVWVEDPTQIDMMFSWTLDSDNKTLIKGAESHAPN